MHTVFMPYGKRDLVEGLLRDMEAEKFELTFNKGREKRKDWFQGVIRMLPFGVLEYIHPITDMDAVLHTLNFRGNESNRYDINGLIFKFLKKITKCEAAPKYTTDKRYLWIQDCVNIIPIGVRFDDYREETSGDNKGWTFEHL